jgi:hypothetical protein
MNATSNADAGKNVLWPGATPFLARVSLQNPFGIRGSLPATVSAPYRQTTRRSRVRSSDSSCLSRLTMLTYST